MTASAPATARPAAGLAAACREALPSLRVALGGALVWGALMGFCAMLGLLRLDWEGTDRIRLVALLFTAGGALAFPAGLFAARLLSRGRSGEVAFAAAFVCLLGATVSVTGALYALQYRAYYAEWHAETFSVTWMFQFVFTVLAALYQFAVLGIRLYFPLGFVALFAAALWFARHRP